MANLTEAVVMKIGSGLDEDKNPKRGYISNCAQSLLRLLNESDEVTVKAIGRDAMLNVVKTITRAEEFSEGKALKAFDFCYKEETLSEGSNPISVFNITVRYV